MGPVVRAGGEVLVQGTLWPVNMGESAGAGRAPAKSKADPDMAMLQERLVPTVLSALAPAPPGLLEPRVVPHMSTWLLAPAVHTHF